MPNGDEPYSAKELDAFFVDLIPLVTKFARQHRLNFSRYYHGSPSLFLRWRSVLGSKRVIQIRRIVHTDRVSIHGASWRAATEQAYQVEPKVEADLSSTSDVAPIMEAVRNCYDELCRQL